MFLFYPDQIPSADAPIPWSEMRSTRCPATYVTTWTVGTRVGVGYLGGHCGECEPCRRGDFVNCTNQPQTGTTVDGGYADVTYARASGLVRIPDGANPLEVAHLLCAGLTIYNALLKINARPGALVAIQGIGGSGIQYANPSANSSCSAPHPIQSRSTPQP